MIPTLIVLGLLAVGVAIVAFATRRGSGAKPVPVDSETGWNDPVTPANAVKADDPFAHAPAPTTSVSEPARTPETHP